MKCLFIAVSDVRQPNTGGWLQCSKRNYALVSKAVGADNCTLVVTSVNVAVLLDTPDGCRYLFKNQPKLVSFLNSIRCLKVLGYIDCLGEVVYKSLPADDPTRRKADISLAKSALDGWASKIQLSQGLDATITYFKELLAQQ